MNGWSPPPHKQLVLISLPSLVATLSYVTTPYLFYNFYPLTFFSFFFLSLFKKIDYVKITDANAHSWLGESVLTASLGLSLDKSLPGGVNPGDVVWLSRRKKIAEGGWTHLGRLRVQLMETLVAKGIVFFLLRSVLFEVCTEKNENVLGLMTLPTQPHFLWITQFPLFTLADKDKIHLSRGRYASTHHPFTAPMYEDLADLKAGKVDSVRGQHYDLVLDGQEIGGGSVRIHDARLQEWVMKEVLQLDEQEMGRFDHLLRALKCGAPPHGGLALGKSFQSASSSSVHIY